MICGMCLIRYAPVVEGAIGGAENSDLPQLHLVTGQGSGLIAEDVRHLQGYSARESYPGPEVNRCSKQCMNLASVQNSPLNR